VYVNIILWKIIGISLFEAVYPLPLILTFLPLADYRSPIPANQLLVEAAGIEPASKKEEFRKTTCLASVFILD